MFKLDVEKAFDNVNWGCLFKLLAAAGFSEKWSKWIKGSMCSSYIFVIVNGEANGFFVASKGLRQGDPLLPVLFVLVMEVLSWMLKSVREKGKFEGLFMNEELKRGEVTHLLFADDTLIFCDANHDQVLHVLAAIVCFQTVTGLRINLDKLVMYTVEDVADPSFLLLSSSVNGEGIPLSTSVSFLKLNRMILPSGIRSWERCRVSLADGAINIFLMARDWSSSERYSRVCPLTCSLFSRHQLLSLKIWKGFKDIFCGMEREKTTGYHWWIRMCARLKMKMGFGN
ncbi:unnamed protein product [Linum trigynum]|uniref:Reverse transcriptase domain-containing protein n=1 Tax=Linum trigynum TaxID=586398 RepID=A0AAV2E4C0_9ROSI